MICKQDIADGNEEKEDIRFVPTAEEIAESRRIIEKIQNDSRMSRPFSKNDTELILKPATKNVKE